MLRATEAKRRIAVLGEMLELGHAAEEQHRRVGRYAKEQGVDLLVGIRGAAKFMLPCSGSLGKHGKERLLIHLGATARQLTSVRVSRLVPICPFLSNLE